MNDTGGASGALMLDLEGLALADGERELLRRPAVGGVVLFARNFASPAQLMELTQSIREAGPDLLIAVDQEGGPVQRFRDGFVRLPALNSLEAVHAREPERALALAGECAWVMAAELLHHGVDLSLAPVLDLYSPGSPVIGRRAFAREPDAAVALGRAYIAGMREAGMRATGKHWPGHGRVAADSHTELPVDGRAVDELMAADGRVFAECLDVLDAVMTAHVAYPALDGEIATFSGAWIAGKLRGELGWRGVVLSDDLSMAAARTAGDAGRRAERALAAGCDAVMVCNDRAAALAVADHLERRGGADGRLGALRGAPAPDARNPRGRERWARATAAIRPLVEQVE